MISIKPSGTEGLCSSDFLPDEVTARFPSVARLFSDVSLADESFIRVSTAPAAIRAGALSRIEERLYNVPKHACFVCKFEVDSRTHNVEGIILDELRENCVFDRVDMDRRSSAYSLFAFSSNELKSFGNLNRIPASTIRALLLHKKKQVFSVTKLLRPSQTKRHPS